ncbi:polysaccharide deacetylase family protein [Flavobacterium sp. T12S277]|uniref:polysaccharide deacetylase family protein n=1 Tax=Flavobacterium sp. T12S277 TaxID=3402752 RepID=UPI003AEBDE2F
MSHKVTIVMYHYVRDLIHSKYPNIKGLDKNDFKGQIEFLAKNYNFITMEEMIDSYYNKTLLPKNAVLLTFDDAYIDHFNVVYPVLNNMGIQGSFFAPVRAVMENSMLDVNKIHFILAAQENINEIIKKIYILLDKYRVEYKLESNLYYYTKLAKENRYDIAEVIFIKRLLQVELEENLRKIITDELFKEIIGVDESIFSRELYMSLDQIKCMCKNGMHIGSHGYDHYWLGSLSRENQKIEIEKSLEFIKAVGGDLNYASICYPYGNYNADTLSLLQNYNFKVGMTTRVEVSDLSLDNPLELPRLDTNDLPKAANIEVNKWYT